MVSPAQIKETFLAKVESGNIRYQGYPVGIVTCAAGASAELVVAGAGPLTDFWLCGFTVGIFAAAAEVTLVLTIGYGGVAGANPPLVALITTFPVTIAAEAIALGPSEAATEMLPYPIRVPGGVRMAVTSAAITGTDGIDEMHLILATAVGS